MPKWEPAADRGLWALSDPWLSNPSQDAKEVLLWARKNLGQYVAVRPCLHSFLTHNKHHPFENKVWEIYIFIKKCIRSLLKSSLQLIMFLHIFVYEYVQLYYGYTTLWSPGVGKILRREFACTCFSKSGDERKGFLSDWCLLPKRDRSSLWNCHMTNSHMVVRSSAHKSS